MLARLVLCQALMFIYLYGSSALLTSSFGFLQDDASLTLARKLRCVQDYMGGFYVGVSYDKIYQNCAGLNREWRANVTLEPDTIYMVKTTSYDYLDPPKYLYYTELVGSSTYFTMLPGIPYDTSKITIKWTPIDPWTSLSIRLKEPNTDDAFLRMFIRNDVTTTVFSHEDAGTMLDKETVLDFPFVAGQLCTVDFEIMPTYTQIYVDGISYHAYLHRKPFEKAKALSLWPKGNGSLYVQSVKMTFPMPIVP